MWVLPSRGRGYDLSAPRDLWRVGPCHPRQDQSKPSPRSHARRRAQAPARGAFPWHLSAEDRVWSHHVGPTCRIPAPCDSPRRGATRSVWWRRVARAILVPPSPAASSEAASRSMRSNRRRDTNPERRLRSALHRRGWRFRVDLAVPVAGGRARPDLAFTRRRVAVFVDGCFWHGCPVHGHPPRSNRGYWGPKLARNAQRDRLDTERLERAGWTVVRLWEHVPIDEGIELVERALSAPAASNGVSAPGS
jgi:DNA mismatch endonuclease (patch repair protein)